MSKNSDINQFLDRLLEKMEEITARIDAVEASVTNSTAKAQKCERLMGGEPQPPKPRPLQPAAKGSLAAKSLGLG